MNIQRRILTLAAIALLPIAAGAATFVVPAAGTGAGLNASQWQTELTLHSTSGAPFTAQLTFHDRTGAGETASIELAPRSTVAVADIVKTRFGRISATGAIEITVGDAFARKLAVASRTFNASAEGEFGQDIPAVNAADAPGPGETIVIAGPVNVADNRFNAGIYAVTAASVRWDLVRADGTTVKSIDADYAAGVQTQYNDAVKTIFGQEPAGSDAVLAVVTKGRAIGYGSAINNPTGDPTYVPGVKTTSDILVQFLGVDSDLDDKINIADADRDGVLDAPLAIYTTSPWPNSFHIIVAGNNPRFELAAPKNDVSISPDGYVIWKPGLVTTATDTLQVRVTVDGVSDVITIPVKYVQ